MRIRMMLFGMIAPVAVAVVVVWPSLEAISFIVRGVALGGWIERGARALTPQTVERIHTLPTRYGPIRARLYRPSARPIRAALLVGGVQPAGIDEPRLTHFAREVAASGWAIVTPELRDLVAYRLTPHSTDMIEDAAVWLTAQRELTVDGQIGLVGISFAGGLSIVAAGRPSLRDRTRFVLSLGGHGDLPRVLQYLCTGIQPALDGTAETRVPHDYGLAVLAFGLAERVVPPGQLPEFRHGVTTFLLASALHATNENESKRLFHRAHELEQTLEEPSRSLMKLINERNVASLGARLLPHVATFGSQPALSPERSVPPRAAVYLLHGLDDNVVPAVETRLLSRWLEGQTKVRSLLTPLITHAMVNRHASLGEYWELIGFWRALLEEA
jgi:dienelactone hydrolase